MLNRLVEVEARYEELNQKLADPEVIQNQNLLRELSREHRSVSKIVDAYRDLKKVMRDLEGNREIIDDGSDEELAVMAKEEIAGLEA
ncbi:MAG: PCRF domain-containing protein, partial [Myxococcota bacterium]